MNPTASLTIKKPRTDGQQLWNILLGDTAKQAILVAYDLKLFSFLAEKPRTLVDICSAIAIERRPAEALLAMLASIELVQVKNNFYSLTSIAEDYLLESSPTYLGYLLDAFIAQEGICSFQALKKAVLNNSPQIYGHGQAFKSHEEQVTLARTFTYSMHSNSMGAALAWPELIDLSKNKLMLDIGGGSGAHAIGAILRWPKLQAVILDRPLVCEVAEEFVTRYNQQNRIETQVSDMWSDPFPKADLHFYGSIYHDWPPEKCRFLTQKSFESLDCGGRIIIHEMLYNECKTGPFIAATSGIGMLLWTKGQQYSGHELSIMLTEAGFTDIEIKTIGYGSIITGCKP
jgi:O-methyltransferase domain/Dimerisation domain